MSALQLWFDRAKAAAMLLQRRFDSRARRERLLLIGAAIAMAWMLADQLWLTPAFKQWSTVRARHAGAGTSLAQLNEEIARRGSEARAAEQQLAQELAQARTRVEQADAELRSFGGSLVAAAEMVPVLDRLLAQTGGLRLRSVQSLGRSEVGAAAPSSAASTPAAGALYRHGVELTVEGSYADLLAYVRAIEAMPQRVLWAGMQLKVEQHPKVLLSLRLYTLSLDRSWLEI